MAEAAQYLRMSGPKVRSWSHGSGLIEASHSRLLSFNNILELHVLNGLRKKHALPMQRIRAAIEQYKKLYDNNHPLLDPRVVTDGFQLFLRSEDEIVNLSRSGQLAIPKIISAYLRRIERHNDDIYFFPFVVHDTEEEPKNIQITPSVAFGKPVLAGTGIKTEVIAGRFLNRDSIADLAEEYEVEQSKIEDALRWELPNLLNVA